VRYFEQGPSSGDAVLFLHGGRFSKQTWKDLGSLDFFAGKGYRVVAIDLPGFGESESNDLEPAEFLSGLLEKLDLERPVIVSPSMSGRFSLPFVSRHPDRIAGYVPVAPAGIPRFADELPKATAPALVVWGSEDRTFPVAGAGKLAGLLPDATVHVIDGAPHPCYLDHREEFHRVLLGFLERVFDRAG
jgi:pimeloyl-ACP methyl ester carboxylesterase